MIAELWYALLALVLAIYVVLDGFDLGVGALHLLVAKTDRERRLVLRAIAPVWDGNEVWLVVAGATLLLAFPRAFAASFSGFYLPLTMVLWLLVFRALGIELRHQLTHHLWTELWDAAFSGASLLLIVFFGAALGNVVRGVDLGPDGRFFLPLFTDFDPSGPPGILDAYTLAVAAHAALALMLHGALYLWLRIAGQPGERARAWAPRLAIALAVLTAVTTGATFLVQPNAGRALAAHPGAGLVPTVALGGLAAIALGIRRGRPPLAFTGSCAYLLGMLGSAAVATFPYVLPGRAPGHGLSLTESAADASSLWTALGWWLPGMALVVAYYAWLYRRMPRRLSLDDLDAGEH